MTETVHGELIQSGVRSCAQTSQQRPACWTTVIAGCHFGWISQGEQHFFGGLEVGMG